MAYTLPVDRQVEVQVAYVDRAGNPARVDGAPTWSSSDPNMVSVTADGADPTKAVVRPMGLLGTAQITASADADLGEGMRELVCLMDVTTIGGDAVAGTITPTGEAVPFPEAQPSEPTPAPSEPAPTEPAPLQPIPGDASSVPTEAPAAAPTGEPNPNPNP